MVSEDSLSQKHFETKILVYAFTINGFFSIMKSYTFTYFYIILGKSRLFLCVKLPIKNLNSGYN